MGLEGVNRADSIILAIKSNSGRWSFIDLLRMGQAVADEAKNNTSIVGQYGEELVAEAFGGTLAAPSQKAFDVSTQTDGDLQVKTFLKGGKPGGIKMFDHDVITVELDPYTGAVLQAKRYVAADLKACFMEVYESKYRGRGMSYSPTHGFAKGWTISAKVGFVDVTDRVAAAVEALCRRAARPELGG